MESVPMLITAGLLNWRGENPRPLTGKRLAAVGALLLGMSIGTVAAWPWYRTEFAGRLHLDPVSITAGLIFRGLALPSPLPVSFYPPLLAVPVWYLLAVHWRRRDRAGLRTAIVFLLSNAAPFLFGQMIFVEMGSGGYAILALLLPLMLAAEGIDAFLAAVERGEHLVVARRRAVAVAAVAVLAVVSFVPPLFRSYAFEEEFTFLRRSLRGLHGTVLTIFDDTNQRPHDLDCCMALPDASLLADFPGLRWQVLDAGAVEGTDLAGLDFDYYYRGSEVALDPESVESWKAQMVDSDPENRAWKRDRIETLEKIDRQIRQIYSLERVAEATLPARTFSFIDFPNQRMQLAVYRHKR
jgi:hypothetical protein